MTDEQTDLVPAPANFVLPAALREALLRYLMGRPYAEVAEGVQALQQLPPLPESE